MSQRVSDERVAQWLESINAEPYPYGLGAPEGRDFARNIAEDLRDSRAEAASLREQLAAARRALDELAKRPPYTVYAVWQRNGDDKAASLLEDWDAKISEARALLAGEGKR
jgi:phytoene dehydrogenase-like protein